MMKENDDELEEDEIRQIEESLKAIKKGEVLEWKKVYKSL